MRFHRLAVTCDCARLCARCHICPTWCSHSCTSCKRITDNPFGSCSSGISTKRSHRATCGCLVRKVFIEPPFRTTVSATAVSAAVLWCPARLVRVARRLSRSSRSCAGVADSAHPRHWSQGAWDIVATPRNTVRSPRPLSPQLIVCLDIQDQIRVVRQKMAEDESGY